MMQWALMGRHYMSAMKRNMLSAGLMGKHGALDERTGTASKPVEVETSTKLFAEYIVDAVSFCVEFLCLMQTFLVHNRRSFQSK